VISERVLKLFRPEELDLLISGSDTAPDFKQLESVCRYEGGFNATHPIIKEFWKIVHALSSQSQRNLLKFWTGTDRVPVRGFSNNQFIIQRAGVDESRLPTASTCYNVLLLPPYTNPGVLKTKLMTAINEANQGFGLK